MKSLPFISKIGLFYKIAFLVLLTLIVAIGVATTVSIREQTETIRVELIKKNKTVSKHLASSVKNAFWSLNWLFVEKQMKEITKSEDVTFLKLVKPNGEVYLASGNKEFEEGLLTPELMNLEKQVLKDGLTSRSGGLIKLIITPVKIGNDKWSLIMGLSLKQIEKAKRTIIKENIVFGSTIFLLGVLVSFFFARGMTRPIRQLVEGTKEIGKGNLDYRIEVKGLDELWDLANSFNDMAENLKTTTTSRAQLAMEINERKQAEESLRESEKKYRTLVEASFDGIFVQKGPKIIFANHRLHNMLGYEEGQLLGLDHWLVYHPDYQKLTMERAKARMRGEKVTSQYEVKLQRKDKSWFYGEISTRVITFPEESGIQVWVKDITERKKADEALRESEEKFRALTENISDITLITDKDGTIKYMSPSVERTLLYSPEEVIGKNFSYFVYPGDYPDFIELLEEVLHNPGKTIATPDIRIRDKNSKWLYLESLFTAMIDIPGVNGIVMNCRDITDRIMAAEEKKTLEAQLRQAQKMEAVGTLAGGVAHDLNNILSGLVSYPELLLMDIPDDSPLRNPILTIQQSGQKAAAIVQDLLTLARRGVAVTEVVKLNDIISEYLKSPEYEKMKSFYPGVEVQTNFESDLLNIIGSPVHLSKTVMNLVSNAAEATPDGGKVSISTVNQYIDRPIRGYDHIEEGDYVTLTVSDTGIGISSEDIDKIFEPFYTKKVMGRSGTGLGMAVVWGTVKDHKGYIDVQSSVGKGATFMLYFPVTRKEITKDESLISIEDYMGRGESILVVDDVKEQRDIASGMLRKLGYSVTSVSSGEEAVEYMRDNSADLLVLDMIMDPGIDGLETYKKILELHPEQKAIIASGFSETDRVKEAQRLGAGAYIKKPYLLKKIGLAVKTELDK